MTENISPDPSNNRLRNILIAVAAIFLSAALFFGLQTKSGSTSLEAQAEKSIPLEVAINNPKPTLMEFYANWCTSCQAMAKDLAQLKQQYGEKVNFVMLNVDNTKWLPEILSYQVDGIPHFVFLNQQGQTVAETIGKQPFSVLEADLNALIASRPLPHTYSSGQVSDFDAPLSSANNQQVAPRTHGSQVK
ncbi:MAG: thioredoxin family protein [Spirulinaceae cyanobacterium]